MTAPRRQSGPMGAAEFMAQLKNDAEYQRRRAKYDEESRRRTEALGIAERPIVADLNRVGTNVDSVWDLVNTSEPYPEALPVLLKHLERGGYPDRVMEGLGRALAVKPAIAYWDRLKALYLAPRTPGEEDGTAVALAACATRTQLDDLIGFLSLAERGESRIYFIRPILSHGGLRGREIVASLQGDPTFGKEATALLSRHISRDRAAK